MNLIHVYTAGSTLQAGESSHDSWLQRMVLRAAHPVSIVFSIIGWTWGVFYLWRHDWVMALIAVGYPKGDAPKRKRKPMDRILFSETWENPFPLSKTE